MTDEKLNDELEQENGLEENVESDPESPELELELEEESEDPAEELAKAREEIAHLKDKILRAAAENENFKKRVERERQTSLKYAGETIFKEILPVVDNLERAVDQGVVDNIDAADNLSALLEGVQLTLKSLVSILEKFEVKPIETVGQVFDPKVQEALTMEASTTIPANHVVNEFEKGYYYKDRLLRAAKVIVSSGNNEAEN